MFHLFYDSFLVFLYRFGWTDGDADVWQIQLPDTDDWKRLVQWQVELTKNGQLLQYMLDQVITKEHAYPDGVFCPPEEPNPGTLGPYKTIKVCGFIFIPGFLSSKPK
jgi:hypothetical protein